MVRQFCGNANRILPEVLEWVLNEGECVTTRGRMVYEQLHVVTELPNPRQRVLSLPHRRANPFFQAAETVWILAGRSDAAWITYFNGKLARYLDDDNPEA